MSPHDRIEAPDLVAAGGQDPVGDLVPLTGVEDGAGGARRGPHFPIIGMGEEGQGGGQQGAGQSQAQRRFHEFIPIQAQQERGGH